MTLPELARRMQALLSEAGNLTRAERTGALLHFAHALTTADKILDPKAHGARGPLTREEWLAVCCVPFDEVEGRDPC